MTGAHGHVPLSASLLEIVGEEESGRRLNLNSLLDKTDGRGIYLVMVLLSLPFITPISFPGASVPLGIVIMFLSLRLAFELPPHLPKFIGARTFSPSGMKMVLRASVRALRYLERMIRPRSAQWITWPFIRMLNALTICWMAFLLALPLPPFPPFTNMFPSYAIILMAVSMMEEDGMMIWLGYAASLGTTLYFLAWAGAISASLIKLFHSIVR
ncbi:MAG TPA: exopolysaccharide biosynthesis protein [Verrucomicrobiae bacterium]|jgi:hypothetical protein|nr:exopolysaccharide biosynthesis protein [Verrucomicrobiae bacterium]